MGVGIGRALGRRLLPPFPFYQKWSVQAACRSKIQQWDERSEDPKLSTDDVRASRLDIGSCLGENSSMGEGA